MVESAAILKSEASESADPETTKTSNKSERPGSVSDSKFSPSLSHDELSGTIPCHKTKSFNENELPESGLDKKAAIVEPKTETSAAEEPKSKSCPGCVEDVENLTKLSCNHEYCSACLQRIFHDACIFESQFPPRCCNKHIEVEQVKDFLTPKLVQLFRAKEAEFGTKDRTYCYSTECGAFILPAQISGPKATCRKYTKVTCMFCKAAAHKDDCPLNYGLQQVNQLAEALGWPRCPSCKTIVSIIDGCHEMMYVPLYS